MGLAKVKEEDSEGEEIPTWSDSIKKWLMYQWIPMQLTIYPNKMFLMLNLST